MMFEKMRAKWTQIIQPLVSKLGNLDPSVLTWMSLFIALIAFYLISTSEMNSRGSFAILIGVLLILVAGILDALDGALARHQGVDGPYGDFLDHTIDRIVDIGLLLAIGLNAAFVQELSSGIIAALMTLLGSYMGTQAQSVGLNRIYGGFSRADRLVLSLVGLIWAAWQAQTGNIGIDFTEFDQIFRILILCNDQLNGMTFAISISAWGGLYTFIVRFIKTRKALLS